MRQHPRVYRTLFVPALLAAFAWSCEGTHSDVIDTVGFPPQIVAAELRPATVNSDTINISGQRSPDDLLTYSVIVTATILHPLGQNHVVDAAVTFGRSTRVPSIATATLRNDGVSPDSSSADSLYTGKLQFILLRSEIGSFYAEASATDEQGYASNTIRRTFTLLRLNQPPLLTNLSAPDTVFLSGQSSFVITVAASDPDGLADILSVTRTTPSNLVLFLNDNGANGDATPGDGIFTETVSLSPPPPAGSYTFTFKATDRSNETSPILTKTIVVAP